MKVSVNCTADIADDLPGGGGGRTQNCLAVCVELQQGKYIFAKTVAENIDVCQ